MAIAFDAASRNSTTSQTVDASFTHTPVGTPAAVVVLISQIGTTDQVVGVTYGGVALSRVNRQSQAGGGDPTQTYVYALFAGIPTGAQTVIVDINSTQAYAAVCATATATSGVIAQDVQNSNNGTANNPSLLLDYTDGIDWLAFVVFCDATNTIAGATLTGGTQMFSNDMGNACGYFNRNSGSGGTSTTFTTTANNASWSWGGIVLKEVVAAGTPSLVMARWN